MRPSLSRLAAELPLLPASREPTTLLTILLDDVLARCDKLCEALELVPRHRPIPAFLQSEVSLEVCVEVLLERDVAHEAHAAECAVKLDSREDFDLGCLRGANCQNNGKVRG